MKKFFVLLLLASTWIGSVSGRNHAESGQGEVDTGPKLETHLYQVSYRSAEDIVQLLAGFLREYPVDLSEKFNTISVTAPTETQVVVRELIKKYDTREKSLHFRFYLVLAKEATSPSPENRGSGTIPKEITSILDEVASVTRYQEFSLVAMPELRTLEGLSSTSEGQRYQVSLDRSRLLDDERIRVERLEVVVTVPDSGGRSNARLQTSFDIENEETIVLGSSQVGQGRALLTLVSVKILE